MKNNIILIGMMGAGKTTVAKELVNEFKNFKIIDTDEEIQKQEKRKIAEIFSTEGEQYFRKIEKEKIEEICQQNFQIISTGGGAFENDENRKNLLNSGVVIYLKASSFEIYKRIKNEHHRPLLKENMSPEKIENILKTRKKNYEKAHIVIDTDGKTPYNIVKEIINDRLICKYKR